MEPIKFPQQTHTLAENQPEYTPLPVHIDQNNSAVPMTCCMKLSPKEMSQVRLTGEIWITQLTFGNAFQPISLSIENPFIQTTHVQGTEAGEKELTCDNPKIVGALTGELVTAIYEAIGAASMCWESPEKAGVFRSEKASEIARNLGRIIAENTTPKI